MMKILIAITTLLIVGWLLWRFYSNRQNLPCPTWLSWMIELDNPFAKAHKANEIINALPLRNNINILDIGCGPGRVLLPLAKKVFNLNGHVTGLDIQAGMIEKTQAKAKQLNITNIVFIHGDIDRVQITQYYDIILMICVLGEIPKKDGRELIIQKIANHLQNESILSITETIFDPHFQSHKSVSAMMQKAGFTELKFIGNRFAYTALFKRHQR